MNKIYQYEPPVEVYLTCPICDKRVGDVMTITFDVRRSNTNFIPPQTDMQRISCCSTCGDILKTLFEKNLNELMEGFKK